MRKDTEVSAGIPGLGLSGLFVLLSALALPFARRRSGSGWPYKNLLILGVVMSALSIVLWQACSEVVTLIHPHTSNGHSHHSVGGTLTGGAWSAPLILISLSIMVLVVLGAEALSRLIGVTLTPTPPPVEPGDHLAARPRDTPAADWRTSSGQPLSPGQQFETADAGRPEHLSFVEGVPASKV